MAASFHDQVRERAGGCCEYCQLPQTCTSLPHEVDHIRSQKLRGPTTLENLCLACARCNWYKGPLDSGYDPETDARTRLFNPRTDTWREHFEWVGATLKGKSVIGRTTIDVLRINQAERVEQRRTLIEIGLFPAATA